MLIQVVIVLWFIMFEKLLAHLAIYFEIQRPFEKLILLSLKHHSLLQSSSVSSQTYFLSENLKDICITMCICVHDWWYTHDIPVEYITLVIILQSWTAIKRSLQAQH